MRVITFYSFKGGVGRSNLLYNVAYLLASEHAGGGGAGNRGGEGRSGIGPDAYDLRLGAYETEEHICQYRESDLDFLARWMEREGIFYFFEHSAEGDKIIFCDAKTLDEDPVGRPVRYDPQLGHDRSARASLRTFTCRHATLPSAVKLKDYDYYARPNLSLTGAARVASRAHPL